MYTISKSDLGNPICLLFSLNSKYKIKPKSQKLGLANIKILYNFVDIKMDIFILRFPKDYSVIKQLAFLKINLKTGEIGKHNKVSNVDQYMYLITIFIH